VGVRSHSPGAVPDGDPDGGEREIGDEGPVAKVGARAEASGG